MLKKSRLFTPGPTPLQPAVQEALARPILHHRTDEFRAVAGDELELRVISLRPRDLAACCGQLLLGQVRALEKARQV